MNRCILRGQQQFTPLLGFQFCNRTTVIVHTLLCYWFIQENNSYPLFSSNVLITEPTSFSSHTVSKQYNSCCTVCWVILFNIPHFLWHCYFPVCKNEIGILFCLFFMQNATKIVVASLKLHFISSKGLSRDLSESNNKLVEYHTQFLLPVWPSITDGSPSLLN